MSLSPRFDAVRLRRWIESIARSVATSSTSRYEIRTVVAVRDGPAIGHGGTADVVDPLGKTSYGFRWYEHRPAAGDRVLVEIPPPGGTRRIAAIDRELTSGDSGGGGGNPHLPIFAAEDFGAKGDGSNDDTSALNEAIAEIGAAGGGILLGVNGGVHAVSGAVHVKVSNVRFDLNGSALVRIGASTDPVVWIHTRGPAERPPDGDPIKIKWSGISNGRIDGHNATTYGLRITSANYIDVHMLRIEGATAWQLYMDCWDNRPSGVLPSDARDNQGCNIRDLELEAIGVAGGMKITGNSDAAIVAGIGANTSLNSFDNIWSIVRDGDGFYWQNADGNVASQLRLFRYPARTGRGLVLGSHNAPKGHARDNIFVGVQMAEGDIWALSDVEPSANNLILGLNTGNAGALPHIAGAASLWYITQEGDSNLAGTGSSLGGDLSGTTAAAVVLGASTTFALSGNSTLSSVTGNLTDVAVSNSRYRWAGATNSTIHGFAGGSIGRLILVSNVSATATLSLADESATEATSTNRIFTPRGLGIVLQSNDAVWLFYDATSSRWRVVARTIAASGVTGLAAVATSGSASDLASGTLPTAQSAALTGDVTKSAGSSVTTLAAGSASNLNSGTLPAGRAPAYTGDVTSSAGATVNTIAARAVTAGKLFAATATSKFLLRKSASGGDWEEGSAADAKTILAIAESDVTNLVTDLAGKSATGHGAADHADITRHFHLLAQDAKLDGGTAATLGTAPSITPVIALADSPTAAAGAYWTVGVPADYASGTISVRPLWTPGSTDAGSHAPRWSVEVKLIQNGVDVTAAGTTTAYTGVSQANTANSMMGTELDTDTGVTPSFPAQSMLRISVRRLGTNAADTYVGVVNLQGVRVTYTANQ